MSIMRLAADCAQTHLLPVGALPPHVPPMRGMQLAASATVLGVTFPSGTQPATTDCTMRLERVKAGHSKIAAMGPSLSAFGRRCGGLQHCQAPVRRRVCWRPTTCGSNDLPSLLNLAATSPVGQPLPPSQNNSTTVAGPLAPPAPRQHAEPDGVGHDRAHQDIVAVRLGGMEYAG